MSANCSADSQRLMIPSSAHRKAEPLGDELRCGILVVTKTRTKFAIQPRLGARPMSSTNVA
jgi:hypothetical protein